MQSPSFQMSDVTGMSKANAVRKPRRRWCQYSLRALLLLMLFAAIGLSWVMTQVHDARQQREVAELIRKKGGLAVYSRAEETWYRTQLRKWLGEDLFVDVIQVGTRDAKKLNETDLKQIGKLHNLKELYLGGCSQCTDDVMSCFTGLKDLNTLWLHDTPVTDVGLRCVGKMKQLRELVLCRTHVSYAGTKHLSDLQQLEELWLIGTQVTDEGIKYLIGMKRLEMLALGPGITDKGLVYLKGAKQLKQLHLVNAQISVLGLSHLTELHGLVLLDLGDTKIGDAGLEMVCQLSQLNDLNLSNTGVSDLELRHLSNLKNLTFLTLCKNQITGEGLKYLTGLKCLQSIQLSNTNVTDDTLHYLEAMPSLEYVNLKNSRVSKDGLRCLKNKKGLVINGVDEELGVE